MEHRLIYIPLVSKLIMAKKRSNVQQLLGVLPVLKLHMGFYKKCTYFSEAWQTNATNGRLC